MNHLENIVTDIAFFIAQQAHSSKQYDTAEYWYKQALKLDPENTEVHYALSYITAQHQKYWDAIYHCTKAMRGRHDAIAQYNRALLRLLVKDYIGGFEDYDARLKFKLNEDSHKARFGDTPWWNGEACDLLYVSGEQGFGDIIMFSRYVPLIKDKFNVKKVVFEVPEVIKSFFQYNFRNNPEIEVVDIFNKIQSQYHTQIASLPRIFATLPVTVPSIKYEAEPEYIDKHKIITHRKKIGYFHSGRADNADMQVLEWNRRRGIEKSELLKHLAVHDNFILIPLQPEENPAIETWSDTAGIMANCDLIIGIDTGMMHMAAALGKPAILLNNFRTCWRWMLEGEHTIWYGKHLKILRQPIDSDWETPLQILNEELKKL